MKTSIEKRIAVLEAKFQREPVILHFADGSQRTIRGDMKHWLALNAAASERYQAEAKGLPAPDNPLSNELDAVKNSVRIDEPAQMFNLLWAMLQGGMPPGSVNP
jgi:hypothetical protein